VRHRAAVLSAVTLLSMAGAARADAPAPTGMTCSDAYTSAQTLRNARKLVEARAALRVCAQSTCKDFIVKDCVEWLDQVEDSLPSVVPMATDPQGNELLDVKVSMDGSVLTEKIDGRSIEIDPGPHTFVFATADGKTVEKQVIVAEGEHGKRIAVVLGTPPPSPPGSPTPVGPPAPGAAPQSAGPSAATTPAGQPTAPVTESGESSSSGNALRVVGVTAASVGLAGLAAGSIFGVLASSDKSSAHCTASSVCPTPGAVQTLRDAGSMASASTIFFIAGGLLTAGGLTMWLAAPSGRIEARPAIGPTGAGAVVTGAW
jgi:hypothetical protein